MSSPDEPLRPWMQGPSRDLLTTRVFDVCSRHSTSAADPSRSGEFFLLRCPDWVNVIALTPDRHIVMVEQFRHGIGQITLELPGGIKETGEAPEDACERELLEESGYAGSRCRLIGQVSANPAMQNNHAHTGLITDAALRGPSRPDHLEEIRVRLVPLGEIPDLVRRGAIHHALIVAAFHHLSLAGL